MYYMIANYIFYSKATHLLAAVTLSTAVLNIVLNYYLIKLNGAIGAAQASTLSLCAGFLLTWFLSSRVFPMPWSLRRSPK